MTPDPLLYFRNLLVSLFQAEELEMFVHLYIGKGLLPIGTISLEVLAFQVARAIEQRGFLQDEMFWRILVEERPRREADIWEVECRFRSPRPLFVRGFKSPQPLFLGGPVGVSNPGRYAMLTESVYRETLKVAHELFETSTPQLSLSHDGWAAFQQSQYIPGSSKGRSRSPQEPATRPPLGVTTFGRTLASSTKCGEDRPAR